MRQQIKETAFDDQGHQVSTQPSGISRRDFLKVTAAGSMAMSAGLLATLTSSGSAEAQQSTSQEARGTSAISLPSGGGAIRGIGETFKPDLFTGSGNFSVPIAVTPGRSGFGHQLTLQYSTGNGNGPFGLGWQLSVPRVTRKTEKGVPQYEDDDTFILSGAEDLVPVRNGNGTPIVPARSGYAVRRFRPRTEGLFARIEQWVRGSDTHWRVTTKDNITNLYGRTKTARIAHPGKPEHIFEWLLEETFDAKGNHILYEYVVDEVQRTSSNGNGQDRPSTQTYLRRILYGNVPEGLTADKRVGPKRMTAGPNDVEGKTPRQYLFEVLFDYGDIPPTPTIPYSWPAESELQPLDGWVPRQDPFSTCRAGFEIRTRYRCHRVLMLHHFAEGELTGAPLVKSTDFAFAADTHTKLSLLTAVTVTGYRKSGQSGAWEYRSARLPSVRFKYSTFAPAQQRFQALIPEGGTTPPSLNNRSTAFLDLFGDGLPDIVSGRAAYWQNLAEGSFVRRELKSFPAGVALGQSGVSIGDLAGDGLPDLLLFRGAASGFYEATGDGGWRSFRPFRSQPLFALDDSNVRLVDLTGDGRPDALRTDDRALVFSRCLGEEGYGASEFVSRRHNLDEFPDVYFSDPRVHLADMNGDGLQDIVLVHAGRIDYWPNLGYGRFGPRIMMAKSPRFGSSFDPKRLFLVDLDGSGCADLVYVEHDHVEFWFNQSGNGWSEQQIITGTPPVDDVTSLQFADLLGRGTATLTWSRDIGANRSGGYRFLDFCGGMKPLLLTEMSNGMGATTRVRYGVSTTHAIRDRKAGRPWVTTLPFPVQVVDMVEVIDHINRAKLVTEYKYHDGYYSGREREFRGFASVEQIDSQDFAAFARPGLHGRGAPLQNVANWLHVPPARTVTWFHTGLYFDEHIVAADGGSFGEKDLTAALRRQFYAGDKQAFRLAPHSVETGSTPHDAYRALRGSILRTEVYADDSSEKAKHPYLVTENRYKAKLIPRGIDDRRPPVYLSMKTETIAYHYERNPDDPRLAQDLVLKFDDFGNPVESVSVAYLRRPAHVAHPEQQRVLATYSIQQYVTQTDNESAYFIGIPCETVRYQIHDLEWSWPSGKDAAAQLLGREAFADIRGRANALDYADKPTGALAKRLIEWTRTYFRSDSDPHEIDPIGNLAHRLPLGKVQSLGLPYETYKAAFSPKLRAEVYGSRLDEFDWVRDGGYHPHPAVAGMEPEAEGYWWIPSGRQSFDPNQFFQPQHTQDPFGNRSKIERDPYGLLPVKATDAVGNEVSARNDYRVLQPYEVTDANGCPSQVAFDALGLVAGTAARGRLGEGDSLDGVVADLSPDETRAHFEDPQKRAAELLQGATTRIIYDLHRFEREGQPVSACTLAREKHMSQTGQKLSAPSEIQQTIAYSDGFGRAVETRTQAEPAPGSDLPRWVVSGAVVLNNKGKPVQQYEPYFSPTQAFGLERHGSTATLFYDPLDRIVCTISPAMRDATERRCYVYEKTTFNAWRKVIWDSHDTVLMRPDEDGEVSGLVKAFVKELRSTADGFVTWFDRRIPDRNNLPSPSQRDPEQVAALRTIPHAGTYTEVLSDVLGRDVLTRQRNRDSEREEIVETRWELDISGNQTAVVDARRFRAFQNIFDLVGRVVHTKSMDAGIRTVWPDTADAPVVAWDAEARRTTTIYDALRRSTVIWVKEGESQFLVQKTVYGEVSEDQAAYARARVYQVYDSAGLLTHAYDFKGNVRVATRVVSREYKRALDWSSPTDWLAAGEVFKATTQYDALNRVIESTDPDNNRHRPTFNKRGLLRSLVLERCADTGCPLYETQPFITDTAYDAKGQRQNIVYGNGVTTVYTYDTDTYRVKRVLTSRLAGPALQDLRYTYDAVGNPTRIENPTLPTVFNRNQEIEPANEYVYDALYRLVEARGREHEGLGACSPPGGSVGWDLGFIPLSPQPASNGRALRNYVEIFKYDVADNLTEIRHSAGTTGSWTRTQVYSQTSNRIISSRVGCADESTFEFPHDPRGNILAMPHLRRMVWDYAGRLCEAELNILSAGPEYDRAYYVYGATGQRVRKVLERGGTPVAERLYLGGFEIYRKYIGSEKTFERKTIHVMDGTRRVALVERRALDVRNEKTGPALRIRYHFDNHLGSVLLETDETATPVTYEEYYAYGGTAYIAATSDIEANRKRYRYSGKERDEESGLYYYGVRYYAPWLARWTTTDPAGATGGDNLYRFGQSNPIRYGDPDGRGVTASDVADASQNIGWSFSIFGLPLPFTAEEVQEKIHAGTEAALGSVTDLLPKSQGVIPSIVRSVGTMDLTIVQTATDLAGGMIAGAYDQGAILRTIMRTGAASGEGWQRIQQGDVAIGISMILGDVSQTLLLLTSLRGGGSPENVRSVARERITSPPPQPTAAPMSRSAGPPDVTDVLLRCRTEAENLADAMIGDDLAHGRSLPGLPAAVRGDWAHAIWTTLVEQAKAIGELPSTIKTAPAPSTVTSARVPRGGVWPDAWDTQTGMGYDLMTASEREVLGHWGRIVGQNVEGTVITDLTEIIYSSWKQVFGGFGK